MNIEGFRFGRLRIDGVDYTKDVIIAGGRVLSPWWREAGGHVFAVRDLEPLMEAAPEVAVLGTGYLGMVRQWQTLFYDGRYAGTPLKNPDFGKIAQAYGIHYRKVSRVVEIDDALKGAADHKGASLVEFLCDPSEIVLPMVPAGGGIADMITSVQKDEGK